jgi:hypothetical protein
MTTRAATWPSGTRVVWRSLTWGEFREIRSLRGTPAEIALAVYQTCLLEGPPPELVPAGAMLWISRDELENSPFAGSFTSLSRALQQIRNTLPNDYLLCAQAFIASVFKIPFGDMDDWDANTLLTRLAQAEFVSGVPLNPVDPKASKSRGHKKGAPASKMTDAQRKILDKRGTPAPTTKDLIEHGEKPSKHREQETETFSYTR